MEAKKENYIDDITGVQRVKTTKHDAKVVVKSPEGTRGSRKKKPRKIVSNQGTPRSEGTHWRIHSPIVPTRD